MGVKLRIATRDDVGDMMPLFLDLYKRDIGAHFSDVLEEYIGSDSHLVAVAIADARIVGLLIGSYRLDIDYECRAGFIDAIVVDEAYRMQGTGKRLVRNFAEWAKTKGCTVLQVLNARGEFFENIGFKERQVRLHQVSVGEIHH